MRHSRAPRLAGLSPVLVVLNWLGVAALAGRVKASLAVIGGVHTALDVIKATMVGAHAVQMVSALVLHGPGHLRDVRRDLEAWMTENEWSPLDEMRGNMGFGRIPDPSRYERARFREMIRWILGEPLTQPTPQA